MIWFYLFKGRHFKNDIHIKTDKLIIKLNQNQTWNVDGEEGPKGSIDLKVLKREIKVFINKKNKNLFMEEENESST